MIWSTLMVEMEGTRKLVMGSLIFLTFQRLSGHLQSIQNYFCIYYKKIRVKSSMLSSC